MEQVNALGYFLEFFVFEMKYPFLLLVLSGGESNLRASKNRVHSLQERWKECPTSERSN
jgi:hypothetical protein